MATKTLEHPLTGDHVIMLVSPEESAGEVLRFEYDARAVTPPAPDHAHPNQEERVKVLAGTLSCRLAGVERALHPGDTLVIPRGVLHALWRADPAGCRSIGEFRPALDTLAMLEAYFTAE